MASDCILCRGAAADPEIERVEVWCDDLWRLTTAFSDAEVIAGMSYLEPRRHIRYVDELDGTEAETFGPVLGRVTKALKSETRAELIYIYVFGGTDPHLHLHLVPHREGDAASEEIIRGKVREERMPNGLVRLVSEDFPLVDQREIEDLIGRLGSALSA